MCVAPGCPVPVAAGSARTTVPSHQPTKKGKDRSSVGQKGKINLFFRIIQQEICNVVKRERIERTTKKKGKILKGPFLFVLSLALIRLNREMDTRRIRAHQYWSKKMPGLLLLLLLHKRRVRQYVYRLYLIPNWWRSLKVGISGLHEYTQYP